VKQLKTGWNRLEIQELLRREQMMKDLQLKGITPKTRKSVWFKRIRDSISSLLPYTHGFSPRPYREALELSYISHSGLEYQTQILKKERIPLLSHFWLLKYGTVTL